MSFRLPFPDHRPRRRRRRPVAVGGRLIALAGSVTATVGLTGVLAAGDALNVADPSARPVPVDLEPDAPVRGTEASSAEIDPEFASVDGTTVESAPPVASTIAPLDGAADSPVRSDRQPQAVSDAS